VYFSWDARKAASNVRKHGVQFEEAATVFADPLALIVEDAVYADRSVIVGQSAAGRLLLAVFMEVHEDSIRIISARLATKRERRQYEDGEQA
jgi:uncharacterized protein